MASFPFFVFPAKSGAENSIPFRQVDGKIQMWKSLKKFYYNKV